MDELARLIACLTRRLGKAPTVQQIASQYSTHTNEWNKPVDGYESRVQDWVRGITFPDADEKDTLRRAANACEGLPPDQHGT